MTGSFEVGHIFGIRIALDWSVAIIFLLVLFQLGAVLFPYWHPDWPPVLIWSVALGTALVFFVSILVHELAHALVGKAYGMRVRSITLFIFGGIANIERDPPSAKAEVMMAIVGPITSFVMGVVFIVLAAWFSNSAWMSAENPMEAIGNLGPVATLLAWVGPINILLAVFNMIPGFPLDGGRVLRGLLWWLTGNLVRATRIAATAGQVLAWSLILAGLAMAFGVPVPFFGRGLAGGLWLVLIGWFLSAAARASYQQVLVDRLLEDVQVRDLMLSHPQIVSPEMTVQNLVDRYMMRSDQRAFPVVDEDRLLGLVCLEDVRRLSRGMWEKKRVSEIMTPAGRIETVEPDDGAVEAVRRLSRLDVAQIPVVERGRLVGLFRRQDFMRWIELSATRDWEHKTA
ncbi:MAG TPA: site-2 protease family protein [Gammaproteobacteria bacterium]